MTKKQDILFFIAHYDVTNRNVTKVSISRLRQLHDIVTNKRKQTFLGPAAAAGCCGHQTEISY